MLESIFPKIIKLFIFIAAVFTINPAQSYARIACKQLQTGKILHAGKCSQKDQKVVKLRCDFKLPNGRIMLLHRGACTPSEAKADVSCFKRSSDGKLFYFHPGRCEQSEEEIKDFCARGNRVLHLGSCDQ